MRIDKNQYTFHGFIRVKERLNVKDKEIKTLSLYAIKNGLNLGDLSEGRLRTFVINKMNQKHKRIKLYRGYVFIFFKNSNRLITSYPIPESLMSEYEIARRRKNKKYEKAKNKNKQERKGK